MNYASASSYQLHRHRHSGTDRYRLLQEDRSLLTSTGRPIPHSRVFADMRLQPFPLVGEPGELLIDGIQSVYIVFRLNYLFVRGLLRRMTRFQRRRAVGNALDKRPMVSCPRFSRRQLQELISHGTFGNLRVFGHG